MKLYTKDGKVSSLNNIILIKDGMQVINPTEEQVLADGWTEYEPEPYVPQPKLEPDMYEMVSAMRMMAQPQLTSLPDGEAVKVKALYDPWASKIGKEIKKDKKVYYDDKLFKARQDINPVLENQPPGSGTQSLYEEINETHAGTLEDPIPYNSEHDPLFSGMELEEGKYYIQDGITYLCTRNTDIAVYADLKDLVGIYVEQA